MKAIYGVKAAVFDLDGTLFDSTRLWAQIDVEFLKKRGLYPTEEYKRGLAALGNREVAEFTVRYYGLKDTPQELMREWASMARHEYEHKIKLFDGAREYLERAARRGVTLLAVTSLARELAEPGMRSNGIYHMFKELITADECGRSKSTPDMFTYAAERAGARPCECVAFDDVAEVIKNAKAAGMKTVAVRGDGSYDDYSQMTDGIADYTVKTVAEAPELFPFKTPGRSAQ